MKMEDIERLEEAARKYSGVDKIRLAFFEGGKFMQSQPNPVIEKLKELQGEYRIKFSVLRIMRDDSNTNRAEFKRLNAKMGCYETFAHELDKILES